MPTSASSVDRCRIATSASRISAEAWSIRSYFIMSPSIPPSKKVSYVDQSRALPSMTPASARRAAAVAAAANASRTSCSCERSVPSSPAIEVSSAPSAAPESVSSCSLAASARSRRAATSPRRGQHRGRRVVLGPGLGEPGLGQRDGVRRGLLLGLLAGQVRVATPAEPGPDARGAERLQLLDVASLLPEHRAGLRQRPGRLVHLDPGPLDATGQPGVLGHRLLRRLELVLDLPCLFPVRHGHTIGPTGAVRGRRAGPCAARCRG